MFARPQLTAAGLEAQITRLQSVTQVEQNIAARRALAAKALADDINWVGLDARLEAALPAGVQLTSVTFTAGVPGTSSRGAPVGSTTSAYTGSTYIGQVAISAQTSGGPSAVAQFVDSIAKVEGLAGLWVSNTTESRAKQDSTVPGLVLAVAPNGNTLVISDPIRGVLYLYSTLSGPTAHLPVWEPPQPGPRIQIPSISSTARHWVAITPIRFMCTTRPPAGAVTI